LPETKKKLGGGKWLGVGGRKSSVEALLFFLSPSSLFKDQQHLFFSLLRILVREGTVNIVEENARRGKCRPDRHLGQLGW
jgi:hypothetical protein